MEEVTYSMKTNFETKLSTIGGTMGLFTGFSLLSAVEIFYHLFKIIFRFICKSLKEVEFKKRKM